MLTNTKTIMNISNGSHSINLDTMSAGRKRESVHVAPRVQCVLTEEQFRSREVQKLLRAKILVDVSAASERRRRRELELGIDPTS